MKTQSETVRDLTEPDWRAREAEHLRKFESAFTRKGSYRPSAAEVLQSEIQSDRIDMFRREY